MSTFVERRALAGPSGAAASPLVSMTWPATPNTPPEINAAVAALFGIRHGRWTSGMNMRSYVNRARPPAWCNVADVERS